MTDIVDRQTRSRMMAGIKAGNTKPELILRRELHCRGFRFRLHRKDLPGSPDIVLPKWRTVIFAHGCFWHRHAGCKLAYSTKSNIAKWTHKFEANIRRDQKAYKALSDAGWRIIVVWECATRGRERERVGAAVEHALRAGTPFTEIRSNASER